MDRHAPATYLEGCEEGLRTARLFLEHVASLNSPLVMPSVIPRFIPTCSMPLMQGALAALLLLLLLLLPASTAAIHRRRVGAASQYCHHGRLHHPQDTATQLGQQYLAPMRTWHICPSCTPAPPHPTPHCKHDNIHVSTAALLLRC
jgi:hypothetical protein